MRRRAFTLIELLVVIAIIAILAAILFPVFAQAREQARKSACLSNVKQLGTAIMMYVQDFDEVFPNAVRGSNPNGSFGASDAWAQSRIFVWGLGISPYVKNAGIFMCPNFKTRFSPPRDPNAVATTDPSEYYGQWQSYGMNVAFGAPPWMGVDFTTTAAEVTEPASTYVLSEVWSYIDGWGFHAMALRTGWSQTLKRFGWPGSEYGIDVWSMHFRHQQGGDNFVFADGHAQWQVGAGEINKEAHWRIKQKNAGSILY
jgi:prepilin-type N-terminal cleavage/methylation domain-containing protein/prepilin-type processing-associated H-X9-DG protein